MISLNIQSVVSKKEALWESIDFYQPDLITICETWLSQSVFDSEVLPEFIEKTEMMAMEAS